ncbi:MAG: hypothetical protein AAF747_11830 [Planctomycetota bacterium]
MTTNAAQAETAPVHRPWLAKVLRIEWLGQTAASICWIVCVFAYGLSTTGDYMQLSAASAWLLANIAAVVTSRKA